MTDPIYDLVLKAEEHVLRDHPLDRIWLAMVLARMRQSLEFDQQTSVEPGSLDLDWLVRPARSNIDHALNALA